MSRCGWCNATDLYNKRGIDGLEAHKIPNTRRACEGPSTSPYSSKITSRSPRNPNSHQKS